MRRLALAFVLASCAGREEPRSVVVGPVPEAGERAPSADRARLPQESPPAPIELALSEMLACVRVEGRVHCTGDVRRDVAIATAPALSGIEDAISLSLGPSFGCAATAAGKVFCFGDNTWGQLGAGLRKDHSDDPVAVIGVTTAARVFVGSSHACAILRDGRVQCWGKNDAGQTGSTTSYRPAARELVVPVAVPTITGAMAISPGEGSTFAVTPGGGTWCFGYIPSDRSGTYGGPSLVPTLEGFDEITSARTGAYCGIKNQNVSCWGDTYAILSPPLREGAGFFHEVGVKSARHLRAGSNHVCAVLTSGAVTCWGGSYASVLGRRTTPADGGVREPQVVPGLAPAVDLAVGGTMSCALASDRPTTAQCWGRFAGGQETTEPVTIRLTE